MLSAKALEGECSKNTEKGRMAEAQRSQRRLIGDVAEKVYTTYKTESLISQVQI